ncbi:hypothetical protein SAMN00790413_03798 [Deinococcus hopiensis KR-140]|uniref:Uncharacterized protein n=1 Tax=Deinococcus hopiensis KR-140 TaxID=695939 RepID=A0A1W1UZG6_9DEIO|nr:hypothetical protein SAMN00790413_03798 [Deinococcus hopiensis KR-140]
MRYGEGISDVTCFAAVTAGRSHTGSTALLSFCIPKLLWGVFR